MASNVDLPVFIHEIPFELDEQKSPITVNFLTCSVHATIDDVAIRKQFLPDGTLKEYGVVVVRDRGIIARAKVVNYAVAVIQKGWVTEVPAFAGPLLGSFPAGRNREIWYVFGRRLDNHQGHPEQQLRAQPSLPPASDAQSGSPSHPPASHDDKQADHMAANSKHEASPQPSQEDFW